MVIWNPRRVNLSVVVVLAALVVAFVESRHSVAAERSLADFKQYAAGRLPGLGNAQLEMQNALKNFQIIYSGSDLLGSWFSETLTIMLDTLFYGKYGTDIGDGIKRYTSNTNGGPCFV